MQKSRVISRLVLVVGLVFASSSQAQDDRMVLGLKALQAKDYASALTYLKPLAEAGDPKALYVISEIYGQGLGVPADTTLASRQLTRSAEAGYVIAQYNLGNHYLNGDWVTKDIAKAAYWWRLAAGQGMPQAQYNLGSLYFYGQGVGQDKEQARLWYRQAAEAGSQRARQALMAIDSMPTTELGMIRETNVPRSVAVDLPKASSLTESPTLPQPDFSGMALGGDWVKAQPGTHYTIQLFASDKPAAVERFLASEDFARQIAVYSFQRKGVTWYGVLYGRFGSKREAAIVTKELSAALQKHKPWIRSFENLHTLMAR